MERAIRPLRRSASLRRLRATPLGARLAWRLIRWRARLAGYAPARNARLATRRALYHVTVEPGLFSFLTTVWNTDPRYLRVLADSVFGQDGAPPFEWVILDNGSTDAGTRAALAEIARHPSIKLERSERNLGIVGGLRTCLARATGRYVLPLDSDDRLDADALRILAWHIRRHDDPALLYTDEDKLYDEVFCYPYFKPDWDPVLFANSCYIAHLTALDRERALALGVYGDAAYEGCHDWDSFQRFAEAGALPAHVPEVVYSWRMHAGSTSGNIGAKDFVYASQRALQTRLVAATGHPERFAIELSPLFPGTPNWRLRRLAVAPRPIVTVVIGDPASAAATAWRRGATYPTQRWVAQPADAPLAALAAHARDAAQADALVRLIADGVAPVPPCDDAAMLWEAVGLFERFADTAMVGGRIVDARDRIVAAGAYLGFGAGCDCPDVGRPLDDPGYQGQMWQQRSVSAIAAALTVIEPGCLADALAACADAPVTLASLGAWCGAQARRTGRRVIYTPFVTGRAAAGLAAPTAAEAQAFAGRAADVIPDAALFSPRLARRGPGYRPAEASGGV